MSARQNGWVPRVITVPGLNGSGPEHWQTWIERQFPRSVRVQQHRWDQPDLAVWSRAVERSLAGSFEQPGFPVFLVAHSFDCLAAVEALRSIANSMDSSIGNSVAGALFVAPANPQRFDLDIATFDRSLTMPSIVAASEDDPWFALEGAQDLARRWGSTFINLGRAGHVNAAAGYGPWPRGKKMIDALICSAARASHCAAHDTHEGV
jgi:predicted alpha/beta hydrolase family esterase